MKQKLISLLTLLLCVCSGAWADEPTYANPEVQTYAEMTFLDVANTTSNATISSGSIKCLSYGVYYAWMTLQKNATNKWMTRAGGDNGDSNNHGYSNPTDVGFLANNVTNGEKNLKITSDRTTCFYVTGCTGVAILAKDNGTNSNKWITLKVEEIASDGSATQKGTIKERKSTTAYILESDASMESNKYYRVTIASGGGSNCNFYQIRFIQGTPATTYDITATVDDAEHGTANANSSKVAENKPVTFLASANVGWQFTKWTNTDTGDDVSTDNPYTIPNVTGNVSLTANFAAATTYGVTISAGPTGAEGNYCGNAVITQNEGSTVTLPAKNSWFYKKGYTATGWTDGTNDYEFGGSFNLTGDVTIYPIFRLNTKAIGDADATVIWNLAKSVTGPVYIENATGYLMTTAVVDGETIDVPMLWKNSLGKIDNRSRDDKSNAQVNGGSIFSIPAIKGLNVTLEATNAITATLDGNAMDATDASPFTANGVYTGVEENVDVAISDGKYFSTVTAVYKVNYTKPTIVAGTYNFETSAYPVTITASEGDLYVSTDGETYTAQTSPYKTTVANGNTIYAKATGDTYADSEVSLYANAFNPVKSNVAWVFGKYSDYASYDPSTDGIFKALEDDYNVIPVAYTSESNSPSEDLKKADLVIISEAIKGNGGDILPNKLKALVGNVPTINMKVFNYTYNENSNENRWGWATAENNPKTAYIVPSSKLFKILDSITFDGDNVNLFSGASGNQVQTIVSWQVEPANNVDMGVGSNSQVAIHAIIDDEHLDKQFFGIGLSSDNRTKYTDNAKTLIKNVAAIMIAGTERLDAKNPVTVTVGAKGYATYVNSDYTLDFTGKSIKAYVASSNAAAKTVTLTQVNKLGKNTPVLLYSETNNDSQTIPAIADGEAETISENYFQKGDGSTAYTWAEDNRIYVLNTAGTPGFYKANNSTVATNKAYLLVPNNYTLARFAGLGFEEDGEATGIKSVETTTDGTVFNLRGQRVAQPQKGLYIMNGKKVVLK